MSGSPNVEGSTIDTASQDGNVLDKWAQGKIDVSFYIIVLNFR